MPLNLFGDSLNEYGGLFGSPEELAAANEKARKDAMLAAGLGLLAGGGPSLTPINFGQAFAQAGMAGLNARDASGQRSMQQATIARQIQERKAQQAQQAALQERLAAGDISGAAVFDPQAANAYRQATAPAQGPDDYTIGDTRYSGRTNQPLASNPKPEGGGYAFLTPEQVSNMGLDPRGKYQIGANGRVEAVVQPPADQKPPEAIRSSQVKFGAALKVFDDYEAAIKRIGPKFIPGGDKTELQTNYNAMVLELKNLGELGVLAGPDMGIINQLLVDPTSLNAQRLGPEGLARNTKALRQYMNRKIEAYDTTQGQGSPSSDPLGLFAK